MFVILTVNHLKKHLIFLQALSTTATSTHPKQDDYTPEILKSPQNEIRKLIWTKDPHFWFSMLPFPFWGFGPCWGALAVSFREGDNSILYSDTTKN